MDEHNKIFPDLEEWLSQFKTPQEIREAVGKAMQDGVDEALELNTRIKEAFRARSFYPDDFTTNSHRIIDKSADKSAELIKKSTDLVSQAALRWLTPPEDQDKTNS